MILRHFGFWILILILVLINFVSASINEDENRINSEGIWHVEPMPDKTIVSRNGNSRFDVGGIMTAFGLKSGESILGLVVFPFMFPLVALLGIALFIISIFGTGAATTAAGRRFDSNNGNDILSADDKTTSQVLDSQECVERICCDIINKGSKYGSTSKIKRFFKLVQVVGPTLEKIDIALSTGHGCSVFKCRFKNLLSDMWSYSKRSRYIS